MKVISIFFYLFPHLNFISESLHDGLVNVEGHVQQCIAIFINMRKIGFETIRVIVL